MTYDELDKLQKYVDNQVDYEKFKDIMKQVYGCGDGYIEEKWPSFKSNQIRFLTSRGEREFFNILQDEIKKRNYQG